MIEKNINEKVEENIDEGRATRVNEFNLCEMVKLNICDVKEEIDDQDNKIFTINILEDKIEKKTTLMRENEVIRIVKALSLDNCNSRKDKNGNDCDFPFIEDLFSLKVSAKEYEKNQSGLITLIYSKIIEKKVNDKTIKEIVEVRRVIFKRLLASTSNIRNKKVIYIREELFDKANCILLCGMPADMQHKQFSKYSAYYALASTDSTPVSTPNIVVIDDFENEITGKCDLVNEKITVGSERVHKITGKALIDKKTGKSKKENDIIKYTVENSVEHTLKVNKPFDGAGLVDVNTATKWSYELGLDYLPSAFQFRAIPGIKGNLYVFDFSKFTEEFKREVIKDEFGNVIIKDAWKKKRQLYNEDGSLAINVILTKSQYKFFDYLEFEDWEKEFGTERHFYKRTFNVAKVSEKFDDIKDKVLLSYQPLQSLNLDINQIEELCKDTVETIKKISTDVNEFLKYRGLMDCNENDKGEKRKKSIIPSYYKALQKNPEKLFGDKYIQHKVQEDIKKFKENTYKGAVLVPGNYQTFMPDIFALAQYAFGITPTGILNGNQVYSKYWLRKKVLEIDIIRFPHIANEHSIGEVVDIDEKFKDYYQYVTEGIVTSIDTFIPMKANSGDFDGDHILTNSSKVLIEAYKLQQSNTIIYVPAERNNTSEPKLDKINDMTKTINTDIKGMSNSIGRVVNQITKLWSLPETSKISDDIKIMSVIGSLTIDFVKTGEKAAIPKDINEFLTNVNKPDFMRIIYPKQARDEKDINRNRAIMGKSPVVLFNDNDCTMNRIYKHMVTELKNIKFNKDDEVFDYTLFMNNPNPNIDGNKTYPIIVETLLALKKEYTIITKENSRERDNGEYDDEQKQDHDFKYRIFNSYARKKLLSLCTTKNKMDIDKLLDYLVYFHYCDNENSKSRDKNIIWNCFGSEFNRRLKLGKNTKFKEIDLIKNDKAVKDIKGKYIHKLKADASKISINIFNILFTQDF